MPNRKWFNGSKERQPHFEKQMWHEQRAHVAPEQLHRSRTLKTISRITGIDIKNYVGELLISKRKISVLDSGAGNLFFSKQLKEAFGKKVDLTALGLSSAEVVPLNRVHNRAKRPLREFAENAKAIDQYVVSFFENFVPRKRYDLIFDIHGPLEKSPFKERIYEQYFNLLKVNGRVLVSGYYRTKIDKFNSYLINVKKAKHILEVKQVGPNAYEIQKVKI